MVVERWKGKDGGLLGVELRQGEYGNAERASRSGRTGQAGQGCDCGLWRSRDKLLLGLADKVSKDSRGRERGREGEREHSTDVEAEARIELR